MSANGKLYLIPSSLGGESIDDIWPAGHKVIMATIDEFIVENLRTARRFLRWAGYSRDFSEVTFHLLNKHTRPEEISTYLSSALKGKDIGLLSEAGSPCIADPGNEIVSMAHNKGITVAPLPGPSSILLALIASGFNGQQFAFHGYLPIEKNEKIRKLKVLEAACWQQNQTQVFMETPFRNNQLMNDLVSTLKDNTLLCVASDLTTAAEFIKSQSIGSWKKEMPDLNKRPSIFLIYRSM